MGDFLSVCVCVCETETLCWKLLFFSPFSCLVCIQAAEREWQAVPTHAGTARAGADAPRPSRLRPLASCRPPSPEPAPRPPLGAGSTAPLRGCLAGGQRTLLSVTFLNKRSRVTRPLPSPRVGHLTPLSTLPGASPCRRGGRTTSPRWPSHVGTRRGSETARVTQFPPLLSSRPFCP